ncbi:Zinc finger, CCCH-type [Corchorus olitorius]|uniref:Zinc finger, CCCH-type n=1 Tax=Corchorus olitorius TaxID=93759 RepID=A0A1R3JBU8_9ROSI|nr:Zinc finger, CCCH-type [Corchorus olitorius]
MDDSEGGLSFDFEGGLDSGPTAPTASMPVVNSDPHAAAVNNNNNNNSAAPGAAQASTNDTAAAAAAVGGGAGRRSFRQTVCRHWLRSLCMKGDACGFLHQYDKSRMPVCRFFRLFGECREQDCVYKHTNEDIKECNMYKLGFCPNGPDCRYRHAKLPGPPPPVEEILQKIQQLSSYNYNNKFFQQRNANFTQQTEKSQIPQGQNNVNQGAGGKPSTTESANVQQQQQVQQPQQQVSQTQIQNVPNVNRTRHFQGCAKMTSKIGGSIGGGNWKYAHGTAHYGRNFSVKWLKLCELSFHKTRHLRNPYNENLPVKISRDCQELEPSIGEQLASLLYVEPDSELMGRGRGRGMMWPPHMPLPRGARPMPGMRGFPPMMMGGDGFSYGPVAPDGFGVPDLFGAPRPFAPYGPRFSGDFAGPGPGMMFPGRPPQPGAMFPGGGLGMMMGPGPGRAPFMGGMGPSGANPVRGGRPVGMPPMFPPHAAPSSQNSIRPVKRDQRTPTNDRYSAGSEQGRGQEMSGPGGRLDDEAHYQQDGQKAHHEDQFVSGNSFRNDDSESEDEAPRRSRHGEGKKKRRSLEGDIATSDH